MFRAPTGAGLPHLHQLVQDLTSSPEEISNHLQITRRTWSTWVSTGQAPRAAMLALFWETRWGHSLIESDLVNRAQQLQGYVAALRREIGHQAWALDKLVMELDQAQSGASNLPIYLVR